MPGLINQSTSSIGVEFTEITATHTVDIQAMQFLPSAEGGRKISGIIIVDSGSGTPIQAKITVTLRDLVYDEFGLYGNSLNADSRKKLNIKY